MPLPPGVKIEHVPQFTYEEVVDIISHAAAVIDNVQIPGDCREIAFTEACRLLSARTTLQMVPNTIGPVDLAALTRGPH